MKLLGICLLAAFAIIIATAASSRSDSSNAAESTESAPEAITGSSVAPMPGDESPMHDPFTIYEHNQPAGTEWTYQQLTPAEQAVVNRGLSDDSRAVNDAFACAATRRTDEARAEAAANRMGIDTLQMGVVP